LERVQRGGGHRHDRVYGQSGPSSLAMTDPTDAADSADSHERFAENTPAQN
jgi:peptidyl-Lys metalloendopeptidase